MNENKPTIRSIADETGVSKSTVSLALKNDPRVARATRVHVLKTAKAMGYRQNPVVAHLMAELSQGQQQGYKANLAVLNTDPNEHAFTEMDTVSDWLGGCERRATELGYKLDTFWLFDPKLTPKGLARILRARNINGILIVNSCASPNLPIEFNVIWEEFSCLVIGNRVTNPPLNFVCNDHYVTTMEAVKKLGGFGYKKPGMVMCEFLDSIVEMKFSAGFVMGHTMVFGNKHIPIIAPAYEEKDQFEAWYQKYKPDVIVAINPWPMDWLNQMGVKIPEEVGLINIDRRKDLKAWAGMDQNSEAIGAAAVEQLIGQVHRNERGIPEVAKCVLVESSWVDGPSLRSA